MKKVITIILITIVLMSSCGGNHYTCPSYGDLNTNQNTNINAQQNNENDTIFNKIIKRKSIKKRNN